MLLHEISKSTCLYDDLFNIAVESLKTKQRTLIRSHKLLPYHMDAV